MRIQFKMNRIIQSLRKIYHGGESISQYFNNLKNALYIYQADKITNITFIIKILDKGDISMLLSQYKHYNNSYNSFATVKILH